MPHPVLFLTDRAVRHQQQALVAAPVALSVTIRRRPNAAELATLLPTAEFIVSERSETVSAAMIAQAPNLRLIVRLGSLPVGIDLAAAHAAGVRVTMQSVLSTSFVAEHVLMLALAVIKRASRSFWLTAHAEPGQAARRTDEDTFAFNWLKLDGIGGLYGRSIAIIGMGEIGVELARRLRPFRPAEVRYHKRTPYPPAIEQALGLQAASLTDCVQHADLVIVLLPCAAETDQVFNADLIGQMRRGAYLVGAGSGSVIDERALIDALQRGHLAGAALDTYEYEPLPADHPLRVIARDPFSNLLLTPHVAAVGGGSRAADYDEISRFLAGEPLQHELAL